MYTTITDVKNSFDIVIGLEVHTQLNTKTKMWCQCEINKFAYANNTVCPICTAQPGTLPVINKEAIHLASLAALATHCRVNNVSRFDRKNYFYPDLPKGYQITQFAVPLAEDGFIEITSESGTTKKIHIKRIQLEEDTGKSTHHADFSLVNLNRCGTPLIEIITGPDMSSPHEASSYLKKLHANLVYLGVTIGNMQDGNFRCDVNISLKKKGSKEFGTRVEVKNVNSFKNVEKSIEFEVVRQANVLTKGEKILQQTLLFDADKNQTRAIRTKSDADDYRYFTEPDLTPIRVTNQELENWKKNLPELPEQKAQRFINQYGITPYDAEVLCHDKEVANYFEESLKYYDKAPKKVANWILSELLHYLNEANISITKSPVNAKNLSELVQLIEDQVISSKMAKEVFLEMYDNKVTAASIVEQRGLKQNSDQGLLESIIDDLIKNNPNEVAELKAGRDRVLGFFVGQVMKKTDGKANPRLTTDLIKKKIQS
jgi:aspartyl-tRNA(Asn)/glutamyl-tRNA(Gln) amidotransferase subunit B